MTPPAAIIDGIEIRVNDGVGAEFLASMGRHMREEREQKMPKLIEEFGEFHDGTLRIDPWKIYPINHSLVGSSYFDKMFRDFVRRAIAQGYEVITWRDWDDAHYGLNVRLRKAL